MVAKPLKPVQIKGMDLKWKTLARSVLTLEPPTQTARPRVERMGNANPPPPEKALPTISIIIPAHNEEAYLGKTLQAMQTLTYPRYETIVVANGCSDRTAVVAQNQCDRLVVTRKSGISFARNLGARVATGDILVFVDADTVLEPEALEVIARDFTREFSAGTLKGVPDSPRPVFHALFGLKNLMHTLSLHRGSIGVIICWKDFFHEGGGFEENLHVMENSQFIKKLQDFGKYRYINDTAATTSMRRYEKTGFWGTTRVWFRYWLQSHWTDLRNKDYAPVR